MIVEILGGAAAIATVFGFVVELLRFRNESRQRESDNCECEKRR